MVRRILLAAACIVPALAGAQSLYPGQFEDKRVVKDAVETEIRCFDLSDVRLLPGRFHDNMLRGFGMAGLHRYRQASAQFQDDGRCLFRKGRRIYDSEEAGRLGVSRL